MANLVEEETELRSAVQYATIQICKEMDAAALQETETTPHAIAALSELAYLYASRTLAQDLPAFCAHAGRKTVTESDVVLMARKNPRVSEKLQDFVQSIKEQKKPDPKPKKKRSKIIDLQKDDDFEMQSIGSSSSSEMELNSPRKPAPTTRITELYAEDSSDDDDMLFAKQAS